MRALVLLLLAIAAVASADILHPQGGSAPLEGLPLRMEFGGTGNTNADFVAGDCVETFTDTDGLLKMRGAGDPCGTGSGGSSPVPTVTPFDCGSGLGVQGINTTPICVPLSTPKPSLAPVPTQTPWACGTGAVAIGMGASAPTCAILPTPDGAGGGSPVEGFAIDVSGSTISLDPTELFGTGNAVTFGAAADAPYTLTFDTGTGADPTLTLDDDSIAFDDETASGSLTVEFNGPVISSAFQGPLACTGCIALGSEVSGTLPIANGGTNASGALSGSSIMISDGSKIKQGAAGTTTTVLHGDAAGAPTFSAVALGADVSGTLPIANGGTGTASTLTGLVRGSGSAMTAAELSSEATTSGSNAVTLVNSAVIGKVLTGYTSGAGTVAATDTILQAIQKLNGNDATNANLTGDVTSVGNATTIAADSVALGTDTTGGYAASVSEGGPATTATALAANGGNCSAGSFPLGVDASGAVETCTALAAGNYLDLSGASFSFDPTEVGSATDSGAVTWGDGTQTTADWTYSLSGSNDPQMNVITGNVTFTNATVSSKAAAPIFTLVDSDIPKTAGTVTGACDDATNCTTAVQFEDSGLKNLISGAGTGSTIVVGSANAASVTVTTDGTGTAEVALPAGSIDSTEILDGTVDISTDTNLTASGGVTLTGDNLTADLGTSVDISAETNLAVTAPIVLTGDTLSITDAAADGATKGAAAFNATNFSAASGVVNVSSVVSQLGQTIEGTELGSPFTIPAGTTVDFGATTSKAPLDLPRDTAANCASVTSEGRICHATDTDVLSVGTGSASKDVAMVSGTQTLTGKTLTDPTINAAGGSIVIPNTTSSAGTTAGQLHFDTNGGTATVPQISVGNGSVALPVRTCWRELLLTITSGDHYLAGASGNATQDLAYNVLPVNGTVSALQCTYGTDVQNAEAVAITLNTAAESSCDASGDEGDATCAWSASSVTCTITGTAGLADFKCADTTHKQAVTTSDRFQFFIDKTGTFTRQLMQCSYMVCADATW